ncbi:hypothetical protein DFH09DRAFT_1301610 [Mycena vulgaris]|nr:hypothetical protein DFH09DRAFT_1301610 [Mycena vulgaris]
MRPNGLGDLQKGERYANIDFIVAAALLGFSLMLLTISYDIACQWQAKLPEDMQLPLDKIKLHLSFKPGIDKSNREGVERTWAVLNPTVYSTKDAGHGQQADTMNGKIDNHDYLKNIGQGLALQQKLVVAISEHDKQIEGFQQVSITVTHDVRKE